MPDSPDNAGMPRRRTITVAPTRRPIAIVGQPSEALRSLVLEYGPCVAFPTITHFRGAQRERWAFVLILRASAWDAALDTLTRGRSSIALVDVELTHEWPEEIARVNGHAELRSFLAGPPPKALEPSRVRPAAPSLPERVPSERPNIQVERAHAPEIPSPPARKFARPRSELLIIASSPELRTRLFRALRGVRPIRVIGDLSELAPELHDPQYWLGIVVADVDLDVAHVAALSRADAVTYRIEAGRELDDAALKHWSWRAVAFEYCNHLTVAQRIVDAYVASRASVYAPSIELTALCACSLSAGERSLALDMTEHTWRWYAKESAGILGESSKVLAQRALEAAGEDGLLAPSRWLAHEERPERDAFSALRTRVPRDILDLPISRVPWSDSKLPELARLTEEFGCQTVDALLSLPADTLGPRWQNARTCDGLQESLLAATPTDNAELPAAAPSFARMKAGLIAAMPTADLAAPLQLEYGAQRVPGATQRALRFHERLLSRLRTRLSELLQTATTLEQLRERDAFFVDVASLSELEHFARAALRLTLYVGRDREGRHTLSLARPAREDVPEFAELRGVRLDHDDFDSPLASLSSVVAPSRPPQLPPPALPPPLAKVVHSKPQIEDGLLVAERTLRSEGKAMLRADLALLLGEKAAQTFYRMAGTRPFIELDARCWGLIDRDVPGGNVAFDAALTLLRSRGLQHSTLNAEIESALRAVSSEHQAWTREMMIAALRYARS